jgi:hypothetical protein
VTDLDLDLSAVPAVDDFSIELRERLIEYVDGAGRRLAWFPAWENADRDLRHFIASDVPIGSLDQPFEDADDAWRIVILEHEGWVYVFEADDPHASAFPRRVRVTRDAYLRAWAALLHRYNPVLSLEELLANAGREPDA